MWAGFAILDELRLVECEIDKLSLVVGDKADKRAAVSSLCLGP